MAKSINRLGLQMIIRQPLAQVNSGSVRLYGRWTHRSPAKVLLPFDSKTKSNLRKEKIIDLDPAILSKTQGARANVAEENEIGEQHILESSLSPEKTKQIKQKREEKLKKRKFYLSQQKVFDDKGEIIYEKLKENDARIRYVTKITQIGTGFVKLLLSSEVGGDK